MEEEGEVQTFSHLPRTTMEEGGSEGDSRQGASGMEDLGEGEGERKKKTLKKIIYIKSYEKNNI